MPNAVVTGAGARVGRAIAVELARQGFEIGVHYRSSSQGAEETAEACREAGGSAWLVQGDLATVRGCRDVVEAVRARCAHLHVLVHNASTFSPDPFDTVSLKTWETMTAVHTRAPFLLTQGLLDRLRAAESTATGAQPGEGGLVVCMVDIGAERPVPGYAAYSVSKAGTLMFVKALAVELAPKVRCIGISPGQVAWPSNYSEAKRDRIVGRIPMGRVGTPEDIARLIRFAAMEAPYLNGEIIDVDGGLSKRY